MEIAELVCNAVYKSSTMATEAFLRDILPEVVRHTSPLCSRKRWGSYPIATVHAYVSRMDFTPPPSHKIPDALLDILNIRNNYNSL